MLQGVPESFVVAAPQAPGSGTANEVFSHAVGALDSGAIDLGLNIPSVGAWFTFQSDVDTYIAFGADDGIEADVNSWRMEADREYRFWCSPAQSRYFSVLRVAASGTILYYCSQPNLPVAP